MDIQKKSDKGNSVSGNLIIVNLEEMLIDLANFIETAIHQILYVI